jgi:hypothetical protein
MLKFLEQSFPEDNSWLGVFENNLVTECILVSLNIHALVLFVETGIIQNPFSRQ